MIFLTQGDLLAFCPVGALCFSWPEEGGGVKLDQILTIFVLLALLNKEKEMYLLRLPREYMVRVSQTLSDISLKYLDARTYSKYLATCHTLDEVGEKI